VDLYIHSPTGLHGVVLNYLGTETFISSTVLVEDEKTVDKYINMNVLYL
jgi:hypothetical protein